ncbi:MAG: archaeosortase/exosortase family protein [Saprospiraceae bacterium]|nr:archaeosortase/exosortase family protein [Saprospiraceae bacterium]MBK9630885.1 archaeosortase/exosortase family protein [Saprospiraceae bacterium]
MMTYYKNLSPIVRFFVHFVTLMLLFYAFYYSSIYENYIMPGLLNFEAKMAKLFLSIFGIKTEVTGDSIHNNVEGVSIKGGCDGMEATFLYIAAVLSLPLVAAKYKYPALIYGLIILVILNIIRIAGLFLAKIHYPSIFEFLHLHGGVVIFMMISIVMWLIWVQWVMKKTNVPQ